MTNNFNPKAWLPQENKEGKSACAQQGAPGTAGTPPHAQAHEDALAVEKALEALEASGTDITPDYQRWRDIGFAFTHAFGEAGRPYFHRVSQFHPEYDSRECDLQYDRCLRSKGSGISLATFFHYLKQAEIPWKPDAPPEPPQRLGDEHWDTHEDPKSFEEPLPGGIFEDGKTAHTGHWKANSSSPSETQELEGMDTSNLPTLPDSIFPTLPPLLQKVTAPAEKPQERDLLLLSSLVALSACLPMVNSKYHRSQMGTNLFLFVTAPASAGKGRMKLSKRLVWPLHHKLREESKLQKQEYELALAAYTAGQTHEKPKKPSEKMLLIPTNNSATGAYELLGANDGVGLMFETEADTLAEALKSEHGNYSYGLRQSFHHETISYYRRTDKEHVEIDHPRLSVLLSGTPRQVSSLIRDTENGLFSRFLFYYMDLKKEWENVFAEDPEYGAEDHFNNLGAEFFSFHQRLEQHGQLMVLFTPEQQQRFNDLFSEILKNITGLENADTGAIVFRMGVICYRFAMLLSTLRLMDRQELPRRLYCTEEDYQTAVSMVLVLFEHSLFVYRWLPENTGVKIITSRKRKFLEALPPGFDRAEYLKVAKALQIPAKTAERYVYDLVDAKFYVRESKGFYVRTKKKLALI